MSCSFCPPLKRKKEFMTEETFKEVLKQVKPYTDYVYFHVKGEPLMHPKLDRFLDLCDEYGLKVNITTNATLLSEKKEMLLNKNALRQLNISLHSFEDGDDESFNGYIDDIINTTKEIKKSMSTYVVMRLWNLKNMDNPRNKKIINKLQSAFSPSEDLNDMIKKASPNKLTERSLTLCENVYLSQEREFKWPDINGDFIGVEGFCYGLRTMCGILVDGSVVPCCLDSDGSAILGNIHENSFGDIISSGMAEEINNGFSERNVVHPLCQRCHYRVRFNRKKRIYKPIND